MEQQILNNNIIKEQIIVTSKYKPPTQTLEVRKHQIIEDKLTQGFLCKPHISLSSFDDMFYMDTEN